MKVLIISTVGLKYEGITSVILSNVKAMNKEGLEIFVAGTIEVDATIRDEFEKNNCVIVDFPSRRTETMKYFRALYKFIHKNKIGVVHAHGNSATLSIELLAAWFAGHYLINFTQMHWRAEQKLENGYLAKKNSMWLPMDVILKSLNSTRKHEH